MKKGKLLPGDRERLAGLSETDRLARRLRGEVDEAGVITPAYAASLAMWDGLHETHRKIREKVQNLRSKGFHEEAGWMEKNFSSTLNRALTAERRKREL